ncbi:hypothetical protein Pcinc_042943 [Petrolisthes cinctipes]|uniref:Uncharacterized protein n=1 Tax=Petrolisthes cinctipes TaxID=88211 RepID=A0AAE1EGQ8_PETCI|nr:hypothetical protein Pcinc_042943 [Petrolisthes cinctipes]
MSQKCLRKSSRHLSRRIPTQRHAQGYHKKIPSHTSRKTPRNPQFIPQGKPQENTKSYLKENPKKTPSHTSRKTPRKYQAIRYLKDNLKEPPSHTSGKPPSGGPLIIWQCLGGSSHLLINEDSIHLNLSLLPASLSIHTH